MSSTDAAPRNNMTAATPKRVEFPNSLGRADMHTPYARFRRHVLLFMLYFLWICGVGGFTSMTVLSGFSIARSVLTLGSYTLPPLVQIYLLVLALYYSYHQLMYHSGAKPQGEWLNLRKFSRRSILDYPYYRYHTCIFEEQEEESLKDREKPMVPLKDKTLFAYHPHGVLSCGFAMNGVHSKRFEESNAHWLVAENLFWFPILRDILKWLNFDNVEKQTFVNYMEQSENVCLIPGGFEEATLFARGKHRVFIKKRFGFIKLALQYGYKVAPVYTFGEEQTFHSFDYFLKQRMLLNKWKVPAVVFFGRLFCFFMPREDVELITVVGKALELPKIEHPTNEDVAKYHKLYVEALVGLFERNKHKYAVDPTVPLEVY